MSRNTNTPYRLNLYFTSQEELDFIKKFLDEKYPEVPRTTPKVRMYLKKQAIAYFKRKENGTN